jgi:hypothetical protein
LPIDILYQNAQKLDPESAIKLAETTMGIYKDNIEKPDSLNSEKPDSLIQKNLELAKQILTETLKVQSTESGLEYFSDWSAFSDIFNGDFRLFLYMFYCGITSIFLTFGAPFWNDIASALLRLQKGTTSAKSPTSSEVSNG